MDYIREKLIKETIRFLEFCQQGVHKGKICTGDYRKLTNKKFSFLENILQEEKKNIYIDKGMKKSLLKLYLNDALISSSCSEMVAGE